MRRSILLFSYGTLQQPEVQQATYGRLLRGEPDALHGYRLVPLPISSPEVIALSGKDVHAIARRTGDNADLIQGMVLKITAEELEATDAYEVDVYARILISLASGRKAHVYVGEDL